MYKVILEVTSPGMLHDELTIEQMKRGLSKPRNRGIASAFVYMGIVENWGSGIPKVFAESAMYGLPEPELVASDMTFITNLFRNEKIFDENNRGDSSFVVSDNVGNVGNVGNAGNTVGSNVSAVGNSADKIEMSLSDSEKRIYVIMKEDPKITIKKIADEIELTTRTIERTIKSLKEKGYVTREGGTRGKWVVLNNDKSCTGTHQIQ